MPAEVFGEVLDVVGGTVLSFCLICVWEDDSKNLRAIPCPSPS